MIGVQGISRAGVVGIPRTVLIEQVVSAVSHDRGNREVGPPWIAFRRVIENRIENDPDTCAVQLP